MQSVVEIPQLAVYILQFVINPVELHIFVIIIILIIVFIEFVKHNITSVAYDKLLENMYSSGLCTNTNY